ncbi:MAG TPA: hypothetical protein VMR98_04065, partial [Candidatus Polarisedimenticolaceae bacterium]|nr:hypothetical protein [Candidatus Polarisedimenticolaceae bacterium]
MKRAKPGGATSSLKQYGMLLGVALAISLVFPLMDYARQDINISQLSELWLMFGLQLVVCLVFFHLYYATLTTKWGKLLATVTSVFILMQKFPQLHDFFSVWTPHWPPVLNSLLITGMMLAGIWAGMRAAEVAIQKWRPTFHHQIFVVGLFICASVIVLNGVSFLSYVIKQNQSYGYKPKSAVSNLKLSGNEG